MKILRWLTTIFDEDYQMIYYDVWWRKSDDLLRYLMKIIRWHTCTSISDEDDWMTYYEICCNVFARLLSDCVISWPGATQRLTAGSCSAVIHRQIIWRYISDMFLAFFAEGCSFCVKEAFIYPRVLRFQRSAFSFVEGRFRTSFQKAWTTLFTVSQVRRWVCLAVRLFVRRLFSRYQRVLRPSCCPDAHSVVPLHGRYVRAQ